MLFNSLEFLLFFIVVTTIFFALPHKYRWFHLLAASCYFYMAFVPIYIVILFGTIIIDYFAGIWIERATGTRRKWLLIISIISNIGVLVVFKYYNFFLDNLNAATGHAGSDTVFPYLNILLPIGLSFHTFQALSYTIEVYRGNHKAEKHFGIYALYVMFYPQLVAGPIERPQNVLHQFHEKKFFDANDFFIGFKMMIWGFFKKIVIADRLAILVNQVYNHPTEHNATMLLIATVFFAIQIYCDFSGYSSIAIGAARVMGFRLMTNFNNPYQARSINEFWKRWHISLSTWFRDYLYISMGGNRVSVPRWYFNLFFVFLVSGFWHGANWTFLIWGALHGLYLVAEILVSKTRETGAGKNGLPKYSGVRRFLQVCLTFTLVTFAWIFFRANSVSDALYIVKNIVKGQWGGLQSGQVFSEFSMVLSFLLIVVLFLAEWKWVDRIIALKLDEKYRLNLAFGIVLITGILVLGVFRKLSFIYFQF
ncbi:MAG: MBOAT family protein [Chitinophagaceae bacterium]|nr:MBOAT family protein [Chitinophagaceae bacterium]